MSRPKIINPDGETRKISVVLASDLVDQYERLATARRISLGQVVREQLEHALAANARESLSLEEGRCTECGYLRRTDIETQLREQLGQIGDDWQVIRTAASRYLVHKNRERYPEFDWRATRETLLGGDAGTWTVEARRAR